ncbi:PREDICTED: protein ROS1-like [Camelina sativa]|uniref:Protein ROS1-like n=1 Tax=Camelina sativa TaxID=90675 RepID=A0ABM0ZMD6_CAMSA|nr:PREDICTED: protein ROS1-like [Camelina sativa]XP_010517794.1 PREDICTED: protein ROS1-like [Camelina sativa]XP_010517795.1 PREDICTED: protein ROS1-like [Camelina sativa]XP_019082347.1 PREDICTED: protein ROS1-like [Camelina sativa]
MREEDPWIPETPMKPTAPIGSNTVEEEAHGNRRRRFVGNEDTESLCFSGQIPKRTGDTELLMKNGNESVQSPSSVSKIKTPEKPKRKKHRPKVLKEAKPKKAPKPPPPKKPVVADSQESKTPPMRTYVRRKKDKDQESTPVESSEDRELLMRKGHESVESPSSVSDNDTIGVSTQSVLKKIS